MTHQFKALLYMFLLCIMTLIMKPFFFMQKKQVWFFIDRPFGIDNSYHLWEYALKQDDEIKNIYLLENGEDAKYKKLEDNNSTVYNFSLRHFWYFIHASKIIVSYDTKPFYFYKQGLIFKKLLKPISELIFIQHGVIKSHLEAYKKAYTNIDTFICSAEKEKKIVKGMGYDNELKITGLPRFDTLINSVPKKQIFFMPTWDASLFGKSEKEFLKSSYFDGIQSLLSSSRLHQILKKYDYTLVYTPHYMMEKYLHLLNASHKNMDILSGKNTDIQQRLKDASILITDYSSIMFDFAYMKKPALYYRFSSHHYKELFDVENDGFGEIITSEKRLIKALELCLDEKTKMNKEYSQNVEKYFMYIDTDNCKRTYNAISDL